MGLSECESEDREEIVCVLDALDECEEPERNVLLKTLTNYFDRLPKYSRSNFFLTSRPYPVVVTAFNGLGSDSSLIHIEDDDANKRRIREEIRLVIDNRS